MTIASTGALRMSALAAEYGGTGARRLSAYYRGAASNFVRKNAANNVAVNMSAAVPLSGPMRLSVFRGQAKGYTYTNTTIRHAYDATHQHYHCHAEFGDDWNGSPWPCFYINNAAMGSSSTSYYALVIYGRSVGPFTFTNNAEIQGCGGAANSGAAQHACYIYNTVAGANRPIIVNNGAIRGGGGGGGKGGTGGTGGACHYVTYVPASGTSYARDSTCWRVGSNSLTYVAWGGTARYGPGAAPGQGFLNPGGDLGIAWFTDSVLRETYAAGGVNYNGYGVRYQQGTHSPAGGAGGAGGNGGAGQGYNNLTADAGLAGANGAAGGNYGSGGGYAGTGGKGGTGGTGGAWGTVGNTGNTGATGGLGSSSDAGNIQPTGGAAGAAGGAKGFAISAASPWGLAVTGTLSGSYTGTAPT
jgi:hypothetical protein